MKIKFLCYKYNDNNNCYDTMKSCYYFNCKNNSTAFPSMKSNFNSIQKKAEKLNAVPIAWVKEERTGRALFL